MAISSVAPAGAIVDRDGRTWTIEELLALVDRAEKDDVPALSILEDSFSANQWWWECFGGDIARQAEESLVLVGGGTSEFRRLAVRKPGGEGRCSRAQHTRGFVQREPMVVGVLRR